MANSQNYGKFGLNNEAAPHVIGVVFQILDFKRNYGHRPINGSSPDVHEDEDSSSEGEAGRDKRDPSSAVWKEAEGRKGFQMCNIHVLECPFCTNNSLSLDCQDCVEKVLEDDFGFKVHNLQDLVPSSLQVCDQRFPGNGQVCDGVANYIDLAGDNDGIFDFEDDDIDGDGSLNIHDNDSDHEDNKDADGDGTPDSEDVDHYSNY